MEINRFGNSFIINLDKHRIKFFWSRNIDFGENFIRRCCERITKKELDLLDDTIRLINKNIAENATPSQEQQDQMLKTFSLVNHIIHMQVYAIIKTMPTQKFEDFVNACYPLVFKTAKKQLEKLYASRYDGCECDLERKINDADTLSDWIITRQIVTRFIANDLTALFKFAV